MLLPELSTFFTSSSGTGTLGTDLFLGALPDSPDTCAALYEYPGEPPEGRLGTDRAWSYETPHVQVRVRSTSYAAGRTLIEQYYQKTARLVNREITGVYYVGADALQAPFSLSRDENNRWHFAFNMRIEKALSDS